MHLNKFEMEGVACHDILFNNLDATLWILDTLYYDKKIQRLKFHCEGVIQ